MLERLKIELSNLRRKKYLLEDSAWDIHYRDDRLLHDYGVGLKNPAVELKSPIMEPMHKEVIPTTVKRIKVNMLIEASKKLHPKSRRDTFAVNNRIIVFEGKVIRFD